MAVTEAADGAVVVSLDGRRVVGQAGGDYKLKPGDSVVFARAVVIF